MNAYLIVSRARVTCQTGNCKTYTARGTHQVIAESIDAAKTKLAKHLTRNNRELLKTVIDMRIIDATEIVAPE